jgi:hypothetical protein
MFRSFIAEVTGDFPEALKSLDEQSSQYTGRHGITIDKFKDTYYREEKYFVRVIVYKRPERPASSVIKT